MNFTFILLLKATAILIISSILLFTFRRSSASLKHWIISLTLIGLLLLPFFTTSLPTWEVETTALELVTEIPLLESRSPDLTSPSLANANTLKSSTATLPAIVDPIEHPSSSLPWTKIVLCIWLLGGIIILFRLFSGIYRIRSISKVAVPYHHSAITPNNKYQLLLSNTIQTPMTWGFFKPFILLPEDAKHWSLKTLQTVIQHEAAHIQRGDYLIHILSWISVALYWFHPLIWWLKNSQQIEREKACDEYVLKSGLSQQEYAEQLVHVARNLSGHTRFNPALPMAQFAEIKNRLFAILEFQRDRFRFTRIKQFQWASFYAGSILLVAILTPVKPATLMEMVAPDHPITELLQEETTAIKEELFLEELILPTNSLLEVIDAPSPENIVESPEPLSTVSIKKIQPSIPIELKFPKKPILAESKSLSEQVTTSEVEKNAYYGKWSEGKSTYEVWTLGNINHSPELPYLEAATPSDMIIIEETRKSIFGTKKFRLIISKVGYDGGLIVSYLDGKPNSWNGSYKVGDPLFLFYEDEEFKFLGKQKMKWILKKLPELSGDIYMAPYDKEKWSAIDQNDPKIQVYQQIKAQQFLPRKELPLNDFEHLPYWKNARHILNPPFDFSSVPLKAQKTNQLSVVKKSKNIGGVKKTRTTTGGNALNLKQKFGRVIYKVPSGAYLADFNFHLRQNEFEKITFALYLYEVNDSGIKNCLHKQPITFETSEEGWITVPLSDHNIQTAGNVLAILELSDVEGTLGKDFLFFSSAPSRYDNFHEATEKEWGFWENNFAWYFNVSY